VSTTVHANLASGDHPGKAVIELHDGLDRVWRKDLCSAAPLAAEPGQCPAGRLVGRTTYVYDGLDRVRVIATGASAYHRPS
jgi:hypothetical protein